MTSPVFFSPDEPINSLLVRLPPPVRDFLAEGIEAFVTLGEEKQRSVTEFAISNAAGRDIGSYGEGATLLAKVAGIDEDVASKVLTGAAFLVIVLSGGKQGAEELLEAGTAAHLFTDKARESIQKVEAIVAPKRETIKEQKRLNNLARAIIPSLTDFHTAVDLRLGYKDEKPVRGVPVVLAHIDTDTDAHCEFQMTVGQARSMLADLERAVRQAEQAQDLLARAIRES